MDLMNWATPFTFLLAALIFYTLYYTSTTPLTHYSALCICSKFPNQHYCNLVRFSFAPSAECALPNHVYFSTLHYLCFAHSFIVVVHRLLSLSSSMVPCPVLIPLTTYVHSLVCSMEHSSNFVQDHTHLGTYL
jgi:hypothetical protein